MRKTLAVALTAAALSFGGAGTAYAVSNAPTAVQQVSAADENGNDHSDKSGLWGLLGLLGLAGLAKRKEHSDTTTGR